MIHILLSARIKRLLIFTSIIVLSGCSNLSEPISMGETKSYWDFDHHVQYKRTQITENEVKLEVISDNKIKFDRLSAFLLRKSYLICGEYGYHLTMKSGVESIDFNRASPNRIKPNLIATVTCQPAIDKASLSSN